jgi:hypothetical protein
MQYNVHNPFTGENTKCETLEEAGSLTTTLINKFISEHNLVVNVIDVLSNGDETWVPAPINNLTSNDIQLLGQDPNLTEEQKLAWILQERDVRLAASDWTQLPDVIALHDDVWLTNWRVYRQALRNLPDTLDINNPVYPVPPL